MSTRRGVLIAVEGVDGAGKHTQVQALRAEFQRLDRRVSCYSFPDYERSRLGGTLKAMLSGKFGNASLIHPMLSAPMFALERAEKREAICRDLDASHVVLCDRYVYSNVAHQACRLPTDERTTFRQWLEQIEFGTLGLPSPDITVLLDVDDLTGSERRRARAQQPESNRELDDYERDEDSLCLARSIYLDLAQDLGWIVVAATSGLALDRKAVTREVLASILPLVQARYDA